MKHHDEPLVTIGIPTFNGEKHITQTIQSSIKQDYPNIEIIISDNASTDNTEFVCQNLIDSHENITYIKHSKNLGPTDNFNYLLSEASGIYFMWLGDDDWIDYDYISKCVAILEKDTNSTIIAGQPKYYCNEVFLYTGNAMNINYQSPRKRVAKYFSSVKHNGVFYGLMRTKEIKKHPLNNVMGGDILFVASLVYMGNIHTLENTSIHRRRGGASSDSKLLSKHMSLPWIDYHFPRISIAKNTFKHITEDTSFLSLPKTLRFTLAIQCVTYATLRKLFSLIFKNKFIEHSATRINL